jgi:septal ring factor EnvC (AmiA/AmiB activator)
MSPSHAGGLILALFLIGPASKAWAQDGRAEARSDLQEAKKQERSILARIEEIDRDIMAAETSLESIQTEIGALEAQLGTNRQKAEVAGGLLEIESKKIGERIGSLYRLQRSGTNRMIFGSEDPTELRRRNAYLIALIDAEMSRLEAFQETVERTNEKLALVESDQLELQQKQSDLQVSLSSLQSQRERRKDLLSEIRSRSDLALQTISEMESSRQSLQDLTGQETLSTTSPAASESASDETSQPPRSFRSSYGRLRWPVAGKVVHRYGKYTDSNGQTVESRGIDIAAEYGAPVRAVHEGEVTLADYVRGYGQTVAVKHGPYTTIYAHLNGIRVRKGQKLQDGDVVGLVGNTGLTEGDGYMLTFEIRYNSHAQNPGPWLAPE